MEISTSADRSWENNTSSVQSLVDALEVAATSDLLDEDWREALRAELLVDAEKVDLGRFEGLLTDAQGNGDAGDECNELLGGDGADTDVPVCFPAWGEECPVKLVRNDLIPSRKESSTISRKKSSS